MDLSLKGSQIHLASRQSKGKTTKTLKCQPIPPSSLAADGQSRRPSSATIYTKRIWSSSPSLQRRRPQSADAIATKCPVRNSCGQCCECGDFVSCKLWKSKKTHYQSVSSSNLLKLLLDEPIKRSWLCRSRKSDNQSELCSVPKRTTSCVNLSSRQEETNTKIGTKSTGSDTTAAAIQESTKIQTKILSSSVQSFSSSVSSESSMSSSNFRKDTRITELWPKADISNEYKPDLRGRVSFGNKSDSMHDIELSDCENDKFNDLTNENVVDRLQLLTTSACLKKSVHFDRSKAETFTEYSKCPSQNCSCRANLNLEIAAARDVLTDDKIEAKCPCKSPNCGNSVKSIHSHDSDIIRDYKNTVKSVADNITNNNTYHQQQQHQQQLELSFISEQFTIRRKTTEPIIPDKQNNLSEAINLNSNKTLTTKHNLHHPTSNETTETSQSSTSTKVKTYPYRSSSEAVIKNYLKVTSGGDPIVATSENNENNKKPIATSSSAMTKVNDSKNNSKIAIVKKTTNRCCHPQREDSNLNEFHLDKVDSWMSLQKSNNCHKVLPIRRTTTTTTTATADDDIEKFSKDSIEDGVEDDSYDKNAPDTSRSSSKSVDNSQDDSTYDEIVSVIKEIEEDKKKDNYAQKQTELDLKINTQEIHPNVEPSNSANDNENGSAAKSLDKYKDILTYLDDVEDSCDKTLLETRRSIPESNRSEIEFVVEPDIAEDVPKLSDLLMLPNHQLARRIVALSLRANELANALYLSKEHVMKIRAEKQKIIRTEKATSATKLKDQKKHYETIVNRHQGFIEQLLKDKGSLCEKVAALTRRLESQNQAWEHKMETEVTRAKEVTLAGEKIRRERWVRENTKKIKELTVKGLETEINKMNANHQKEINDLKRAHQEELMAAIDDARQKHDQIETTIRESCAQDREQIIEKERNAIRERFERHLEEERRSFDEQKTKLCDDFNADRLRLEGELKAKEMEYQHKRQELVQEKESAVAQVIAEMQEKFSKEEEKYQNRFDSIGKQYEADFEIWKKEYENRCKMQQVEAENNIRQRCRVERDHQIDEIVCRMDAEALKQSQDFEMKMNRLKEKYEKDLSELENVEKSLREKYAEARNRLAESDAEVRNLQAESKQIRIELEHSKKMCNEFLTERDQLRENIRTEVQAEVATLKSERDNEIQRIHRRVQQAIEKKDATIELLQKENGALRERCIKLEAIIRQQRKDYCAK